MLVLSARESEGTEDSERLEDCEADEDSEGGEETVALGSSLLESTPLDSRPLEVPLLRSGSRVVELPVVGNSPSEGRGIVPFPLNVEFPKSVPSCGSAVEFPASVELSG